jgi:hypothetical protein
MAIKVLKSGLMSDDFEIGTEPYVLKDALVMRVGDYDALAPDEIAAMKQARYDNWYAIVTAPPVEEPIEEITVNPAV